MPIGLRFGKGGMDGREVSVTTILPDAEYSIKEIGKKYVLLDISITIGVKQHPNRSSNWIVYISIQQ